MCIKYIKGIRIVLANGSIDPWHALGFLKSTDPNRPTISINDSINKVVLYG